MYGHIKNKISLRTIKKPLNPMGWPKEIFDLVKEYREKFKMNNYNAILFNSESYLRDKNFIIAKNCSINTHKFRKKTQINNVLVSENGIGARNNVTYYSNF